MTNSEESSNNKLNIIEDGATTRNSKKIFIIRHGQSTFNVAYHANNRVDPMLFDARLTEEGIQQTMELSKNVEKYLKNEEIELIITSPLTRALHTTRTGFGELMKSNVNIKCIVNSLHSETVITSDDNGRVKSIIELENPDFDFNSIEERWWYLPQEIKNDLSINTEEYFKTIGYREPEESFLQRIQEFKKFLISRPEESIAVIGHSDFFYHLFDKKIPHMKNCQIVKWDIHTNETIYITN